MKKTGLHRYAYDFRVGYNAADVNNILGIHKYLMKKQDNIWIYLKNVYYSNRIYRIKWL